MPAKSLRDIIRDQDGQLLLGQTQTPGVAAQSPEAAAAQGASPDAAKMAGTPASGGAAPGAGAPGQAPQPLSAGTAEGAGSVQPRTPEPARLREVMRQEAAVQQTATAAQADKQAEAKRMETQFGDLGHRVQTLVDRYLTPAAAPSTPPVDPSTGAPAVGMAPAPTTAPVLGILGDISKLTPEQQAAMQAIASSGGTPQTIADAKRAGIPDPFAYITNKDQVAAAMGGVAAGLTPDKIMLDEKTIADLGQTPEQLAASLGVPVEQLAGMSLEQMQRQMETRLTAEFNSVRDAATRAIDPALGPNERAAARAELKQLGAAGVYATEADMHRLEQSIDSADEITFAGKSMSVAEVLDDEFMTGLVKNYVDSPADSDARKRLREDSPQLAAWIDQNESALREASLQLEGAATVYQEIQDSVTKTTQDITTFTGNQVTPEVASQLLELLVPGSTSGYLTEAVDLTQFPGLAALSDEAAITKAGMDPATFQKNFAAIANVSPEAAAALAKLSPAELQALGAGTRDDPKFQNYVTYVQKWEQFEELDANDPEQMMDYIFGPDSSVASIEKMWATEVAKARLGAPSAWFKEASRVLDTDHDGVIDDASALHGTLSGMLGGGGAIADPATLDAAKLKQITPTGSRMSGNSAIASLMTAMADGVVTAAEIPSNFGSSASYSDLLQIDTSTFDDSAKKAFGDALGNKELGAQINSLSSTTGLTFSGGDYTPPSGSTASQRQATMNAIQKLDQAWAALKHNGSRTKATYDYHRAKLMALYKRLGGT